MKQILIVIGLFLSFNLFAVEGVNADGKFFYRMPEGELVKRDASLFVPAMGMGKVVLTMGDYTLESHAFKVVKKRGETKFFVLFLNPPMAPENTVMMLKGTYLRGSNKAVYYGNVYKGPASGHHHLANFEKGHHGHSNLRYSGGFMFKKEIE